MACSTCWLVGSTYRDGPLSCPQPIAQLWQTSHKRRYAGGHLATPTISQRTLAPARPPTDM
jgi:hypothetical protein